MNDCRIKVLVRKNLKMSPGKIAAQSVHAALSLNSLLENYYAGERKEYCGAILDGSESVVVLQVSDAKFEEARVKLFDKLYWIVRDKGLTEVPPGTETCIAFIDNGIVAAETVEGSKEEQK